MTMRYGSSAALPFTLAGLRRGLLAGLPFILSNGVAGVVMGVAYRGLGLDFTTAVLFSLIVYSATAQAVVLGLWALPPPVAVMMLACAATNARYLVMGAHLRQLFADMPRRVMLPILALLGDASWFMTVAEAEQPSAAGAMPATSWAAACPWPSVGSAARRSATLCPGGRMAPWRWPPPSCLWPSSWRCCPRNGAAGEACSHGPSPRRRGSRLPACWTRAGRC
jgi:hypothetical protein